MVFDLLLYFHVDIKSKLNYLKFPNNLTANSEDENR